MTSELLELRRQVAAIDLEIVTALAERSRFDLRSPVPRNPYDSATDPAEAALMDRILADYAISIAGTLTAGETGLHDPSACARADRAVIAAIQRRLHVVLEIGRVKEKSQRSRFSALIAARDAPALEEAITQPDVEAQVVARAAVHAAELRAADMPADLPDRVAMVYLDPIIPLARRVQVDALLGS